MTSGTSRATLSQIDQDRPGGRTAVVSYDRRRQALRREHAVLYAARTDLSAVNTHSTGQE